MKDPSDSNGKLTRDFSTCSASLINLYALMLLLFVHVVFPFVWFVLLLVLSCLVCNFCWFGRVYCCSCLVCVVILCVFVVLCAYAVFFTLDAGLLARSQYSEGPATGHLDTGFFLVSLYLKTNAEMVPKIPSCHYMLM